MSIFLNFAILKFQFHLSDGFTDCTKVFIQKYLVPLSKTFALKIVVFDKAMGVN